MATKKSTKAPAKKAAVKKSSKKAPAEETAPTPEADATTEEAATTPEADAPAEDTATTPETISNELIEELGGDSFKASVLAIGFLGKLPGLRIKHKLVNDSNVTKILVNPDSTVSMYFSKVVGGTYNKTVKAFENIERGSIKTVFQDFTGFKY